MGDKDFRSALIKLATGVWRLQGKLAATDAENMSKMLGSLIRQVDSMADILAESGVKVQSHTGEPFDAGQAVQVIAFTPASGVERETVIETISPTVYLDGQLARLGEIIVATPETNTATHTDPEVNDDSIDG
jgi:molecular chaperone GrpE (heat shock protein)